MLVLPTASVMSLNNLQALLRCQSRKASTDGCGGSPAMKPQSWVRDFVARQVDLSYHMTIQIQLVKWQPYQQILWFDITMTNTNSTVNVSKWSANLYQQRTLHQYVTWEREMFCVFIHEKIKLYTTTRQTERHPDTHQVGEYSTLAQCWGFYNAHEEANRHIAHLKETYTPGKYTASHRPTAFAGSSDYNALQFGTLSLEHIPEPDWGTTHPCRWWRKNNASKPRCLGGQGAAWFVVRDFCNACLARPSWWRQFPLSLCISPGRAHTIPSLKK